MPPERIAVALLATLLVWSCAPSTPSEPGSPAVDSAAIERGRLVFETEACGACHGDHGEGTEVAPSLAGLASHWQRDELASFLADPVPVLDAEPRLRELAARYELEMPGVADSSAEEVEDLVEYLLTGLH